MFRDCLKFLNWTLKTAYNEIKYLRPIKAVNHPIIEIIKVTKKRGCDKLKIINDKKKPFVDQ